MVSYSEAEIRALSVYEITHPDEIEADIPQRKKTVEGGLESYRLKKRILHKAGHVVRIDITRTIVLRQLPKAALLPASHCGALIIWSAFFNHIATCLTKTRP